MALKSVVEIEVKPTGAGVQAVVGQMQQVEAAAKKAQGEVSKTTNRIGEVSDKIGRSATTLARSADSFGLPAGALRALDDVMDVTELGFTNMSKSALTASASMKTFSLSMLGPVAAVAAVAYALGTLLDKISIVRKFADAMRDVFTGNWLGDPLKGATAGLADFSKAMGASDLEMWRKHTEELKKQGSTVKEINEFLKQAPPAIQKQLGYTKEAVKLDEQRLKLTKETAELAHKDLLTFADDYYKAMVSIVKGPTEDLKDLYQDLADESERLLESTKQIAKETLDSKKMGRLREGDMVFGDSGLWTRHGDVIAQEQQNQIDKQGELVKKTFDWSSALGHVADVFGFLGGGGENAFTRIGRAAAIAADTIGQAAGGWGKLDTKGKVAAFSGAANIAAGFMGPDSKTGAGLQGAAAGAQMGMAAGPYGAIAGAAVGFVVGWIKKKKELEKELKAMKGQFVDSFGGMDELKAKAAAAGVSLDKFFSAKDKKGLQAAIADVTKGLEAFEKKMQGLKDARTAVESIMSRMSEGGFSEKLTASLGVLIGKVQDALLKSGLGYMAAGPLRDSKEYQGAAGMSQDVADLLKGMREGGAIDSGVMAAAGASAEELRQQAVDAATAAGLAPAEATKAGFGAIAPLLREQLNAAIASGQELDENTKRLIEEAKANGINIVADPMIESVAVQKAMLKELQGMNDSGGGAPDEGFASGTKGLRIVRRDMLARVHAGEGMMVVPRGEMQSLSFGSFARGSDAGDWEPRERGGGGPSVPMVPATSTTGGTGASGTSSTDDGGGAGASAPTVQLVNAPQITIVDNSPVKTVEGQIAFGRYVVAEVNRALDQNNQDLEYRIARIARREVG